MANVLSDVQQAEFQQQGYLGLSGLVSQDWLARLQDVTNEYVEESRQADRSDRRFDLEPSHTAQDPRIRRLNSPVDIHETYWEFASQGPFADIAEDLLGSSVKFHHSKLNFKWAGGGEEVKWHQDIQFWPHTNYDVVTLGIYLVDVDETMAPMGVVPGSHQAELFDLYDDDGQWTGNIKERDLCRVNAAAAGYLQGPAGTVTAHHCRSIHGSPVNQSGQPRPLLLCAYSAGDAIPITNLTAGSKHAEAQIRGTAARWARFDPRPCLMPPDWSKRGGQKSIFEHQQGQ